MKNLVTKSIHKQKRKTDGLRICVMRRIKPEYDFDMWIPELAPSEKLLKEYIIDKKITWDEFSKKFTQERLSKQKTKKLIETLVFLTQSTKITLLCGENSAKYCHRSLIIKECEKQKKLNRLDNR